MTHPLRVVKNCTAHPLPRVFVNGVESNFLLVNSGVPQGSILGAFLFLIYINDFEKASNYFSLRLFADDTSLAATGKDLDVLLQRINSELPAIREWLCSNRLTLNLSKTKYLVFQPRQKINSQKNQQISTQNSLIVLNIWGSFLIVSCHGMSIFIILVVKLVKVSILSLN